MNVSRRCNLLKARLKSVWLWLSSWSWPRRIAFVALCLLLLGYLFLLPRHLFKVPYSTVVHDRHNELLGARLASDGQWRFPAADTVPYKFKACLIQFEDRYFYFHHGVNPIAVVRALYQNVTQRHIVSGASTITMQTVRIARNKSRTWNEKIIEMLWATRLEHRYGKEQILALYASHAPFGGNVVGIEAAAQRYFGHASTELSWAEAATLAILPNAPAMIHPGKNRARLLSKRNRLLTSLHKNGYIDKEDYLLALDESLPESTFAFPSLAPHLVNRYFVKRKGEQITTTIDRQLQQQVEEVLRQHNQDFRQQDINNLAAIVIDVATNEVVAYCGNVTDRQQTHGNQVDVIRARRSTGSILKPLLYCAAMQDGVILPNTLLADIPININGFIPQNFDLNYDGAVPASDALRRSLNIPFVMLLKQYSVPKFYRFLKNAGITTLDRPADDYGLSLILGGAEASLWDVSAIYCDMARTLLKLPLTQLTTDQQRNKRQGKNVFTTGGVWLTFNILKELNRPGEIDWHAIPSIQNVAWKTGTSYGFRDAWAVGATSRYVVGVWVGNASGEGKPGLIGAQTAGPVMFDIFNLLPQSRWFARPQGELVQATVCHQSGHLRGRYCDDVDTLWICSNGQRTTTCPYHTLTLNDQGDQTLVSEHSFVLPAAWAWYYKQKHPDYQESSLSAFGADDDRVMQFIYPAHKVTHLTLPKQIDGAQGEVTFELVHAAPHTAVFWHIDNEYKTATRDFHKYTTTLSKGKHNITVVDENGNNLTIWVIAE